MRVLWVLLLAASLASAQLLDEVADNAREFAASPTWSYNPKATTLKKALGRWLDSELSGKAAPPSADILNHKLTSRGILDKGVEPIQVERLAPDLVIVRIALRMECARNEAAWLYKNDRGWRIVADIYEDSPAEQTAPPLFPFVKLSAMTARGTCLLVAAGYDSWCTSAWHNYRWKVWEVPAAGPARLLHSSTRLGFIDREDVEVSPAGVVLQYRVGSHSIDVHNRQQYERWEYREDGSLRRVEPFATTAMNFFEEWLDQPWSVARHWSSGPDLEPVHAALAEVPFEFGPVGQCGELTQIIIDAEKTPRRYLVVRALAKDRWRIEGFSTCPLCPE